mmetsp:Transcript_30057/g.54809  ORF Transcript_30057/g.54809 Transcript_30057/m.54809 type:complete len:337 (+) Transcript_30057:75-1085(+)
MAWCMARALGMLAFLATGACALERRSFLGKTLSQAASVNISTSFPTPEDALHAPLFDRLVTELFHNTTTDHTAAFAEDETEKRRKIVCYLKTLTDASKIGSLTKQGSSLLSAMTAQGWAHRKCAVVSSSGIMRLHAHGARIDSAELVLRFNDAPLKGFEQMVGSKDMVRFENMHWAERVLNGQLQADPKVIYVYVLSGGTLHAPAWSLLAQTRPDLQLFEVPGEMVKNVESALRALFDHTSFAGQQTLPTSGAMGMIVSLALCSQVEAFGMAMSQEAVQMKEKVDYHYYEAGGMASENNWHGSFTAEKHLWRYLSTNPGLVDSQEISTIDAPSCGV